MKNKTLEFYNTNSKDYTQETLHVNFYTLQEHFLQYVPKDGIILDLGCGSGRDSKYFLDKGYTVEAMDGSIEMCKIASEVTGIMVQHKLFRELDVCKRYDAIWASASLLHCPRCELKDIFSKIHMALKDDGIFYCSFKYGDFEGYRTDRYFTDMTEESLFAIYNEYFNKVEHWISEDVRSNYTQVWLNVILKKI